MWHSTAARKVGKSGKMVPRVFARWPPASQADGPTILSPCVGGLPAGSAAEMAILPIHDANGALLAALRRLPFGRRPDYAGLCLCDPFYRLEDLVAAVERAGIRGIANFPTVAVLDAPDRDKSFVALHQRELEALKRMRDIGLATLQIGRGEQEGVALLEKLQFDVNENGVIRSAQDDRQDFSP